MKLKMTLALTVIGLSALSVQTAETGRASAEGWRRDLQPAIDRAIAFLEKQQETNGGWAPFDQPAMTAMALRACMDEPSGRIRAHPPRFVARGYEHLVRCRNENGTFGTNYITYNTALASLAFHAARKPEYRPMIDQARAFLAGQQLDLNEKGKADHPFDGGIGYGDGSVKVNLANTHSALEALFHTGRSQNGGATDWAALDRPAMLEFLRRCQNLLLVNRETWANEDKGNRGGFIYYPGKSFAGETNINGKVLHISYGSMTCAGLASYLYLDYARDSHEIFMARLWLQKNFKLDENPKMGKDGLYYYYMMLAKALDLYGDPITDSQGRPRDWRSLLASEILGRQQADGSWVNSSDRWWEAKPVLTTSYALIALQTIAHPASPLPLRKGSETSKR